MKNLLTGLLVSALFCFGVTAMANHHESETEAKEIHADTNNDGKVSFEEFKAARIKHMEAHFKRRDLNNDGFIDANEKKAAREQRRSHHQKACKRKKDAVVE